MCDCVKEINQALADDGSNTVIDVPLVLNITKGTMTASRVTIVTAKRDPKRREKPSQLFAAFCPFCGEKYPDEEE